MLRILDKLLLFAMCSCLVFQLEGDYRRVVIFIIGLIVAALTLYIENRKVIGALLIAMAVLCLIEPGFTFLLPLVFFDSFWFSLWWGMGFAILFFYALPLKSMERKQKLKPYILLNFLEYVLTHHKIHY